jgi:transposase
LQPYISARQCKIHTAANVKAWFAPYDMVLENLLPYFPDLNPIEHVWRRLKAKAQDMHPDLKATPCRPRAVQERRSEVLQKVWDKVEESYLESLWRSMPS